MSPLYLRAVVCFLGLALLCPAISLGQGPAAFPSTQEVEDMLRREPVNLASWSAWRDRLRSWLGDRGKRTDAAFDEALKFLRGQANESGALPEAFAQDALAYYLLGNSYFYDVKNQTDPTANWLKAEQAYRRSIGLDAKIANVHRNLARILVVQEQQATKDARQPTPDTPRLQEAGRELAVAKQLEPKLPLLRLVEGELAEAQGRYAQAEEFFRQAMDEEPDHAAELAFPVARTILRNQQRLGTVPAIKSLVDRFPDNGPLACLYAVALAGHDDARAAVKELNRARSLGTDPAQVLSPAIVRKIEEAGAPGLLEQVGWIFLYFTGFYGVVMALMAMMGAILAGRTHGSQALQLLSASPDEMVTAGQVLRTQQETSLAKFYALALVAGLVLFYLSIPFVLAGLLVGTVGLLYLALMMGRVPIKLLLIVGIIGGTSMWAVLKSLFSRPGRGSFGLLKKREDCPRLHQAITEVARRVDTDPVDELYLAPGASIGVHQEGRGPFGIFGVKRRVLTLGLSTMHYLTVSELQAILAHEYAHFSHSDTYYSRFIYQVQMSIEDALNGMGQSGGWWQYGNPFYWFLYLYYKAYGLLSAGYSRSREFLADRMAVTLYGSDVFVSALTKVCTDGTLFEVTMYDHIGQLLSENKAFINMYAAFRDFRNESIKPEDREAFYRKILDEKESLFASHPTFKERVAAVMTLPRAPQENAASALELFDNPEEIEKELTEFMTGYLSYVRQMQAAAAAQAAQ